MLNQGMGQREIIGFFRAKYGEKILSAPTREGFNLVAWIMPFAAVFAGCFIIVGAIYRWRANQVVEDRNWAIDQEPDPELRRQLQQEIEEQR